jgi:2-polyprenyl-3-methyl-5-hydroxy-6-metoxy-1,4-benzoquinol methylase
VEKWVCIICGSENWEEVKNISDTSYGGKFTIKRCKTCGLMRTYPQPSKEELKEYSGETVMGLEYSSLSNKIARLIRKTPYENNIWKKLLGKLLFIILSKYVAIIIPPEKKGKLLDIGCGGGTLTGWMAEFGWDVYGIDPSEHACKVAEKRGIKVFCGELTDAKYPDKFFDVIVMAHSLEHIYNPVETLHEVHRILKDDGLLIIDVPNTESYDIKIYGKYHPNWNLPFHLWHFNKSNLIQILNASGFKIKYFKYRLPKLLDWDNLKKYIKERNRISSFLFKLVVLKPLSFLFSRERG